MNECKLIPVGYYGTASTIFYVSHYVLETPQGFQKIFPNRDSAKVFCEENNLYLKG